MRVCTKQDARNNERGTAYGRRAQTASHGVPARRRWPLMSQQMVITGAIAFGTMAETLVFLMTVAAGQPSFLALGVAIALLIILYAIEYTNMLEETETDQEVA